MKISFILLSLLLVAVLIITGCMSFRKTTNSVKKDFKKANLNVLVETDSFNSKTTRLIAYKNNAANPTLIFVHGAPGSSSAFTGYIKDTLLNKQYNIVVIDRLGYGYSDYGNYASINSQAEWLKALVLEQTNPKNVFLIGHSFGGSIVARAAFLLNDNIGGTIMLSPALDPLHEQYFFGGKLAYWKSTKWLFSKAWQVSAVEKYQHVVELKTMENDWLKIKSPVLHVHGTKDKLVPYINLAFSKAHFDSAFLETLSWEGKGHLIPFTEKDSTIKMINNFVRKHY